MGRQGHERSGCVCVDPRVVPGCCGGHSPPPPCNPVHAQYHSVCTSHAWHSGRLQHASAACPLQRPHEKAADSVLRTHACASLATRASVLEDVAEPVAARCLHSATPVRWRRGNSLETVAMTACPNGRRQMVHARTLSELQGTPGMRMVSDATSRKGRWRCVPRHARSA